MRRPDWHFGQDFHHPHHIQRLHIEQRFYTQQPACESPPRPYTWSWGKRSRKARTNAAPCWSPDASAATINSGAALPCVRRLIH